MLCRHSVRRRPCFDRPEVGKSVDFFKKIWIFRPIRPDSADPRLLATSIASTIVSVADTTQRAARTHKGITMNEPRITTMTLYRGTPDTASGCEGECWTDDKHVADKYAAYHWGGLYEVEVKIDLNNIPEAPRCEHVMGEGPDCPADDPEFRAKYAAEGHTWIIYDDMDPDGYEMNCFRLVREIKLDSKLIDDYR